MNVSAQNKGFDFLQKKMYDGGKSNYVMIFAHRGNWRGAPENSLQAYKQCIDGGIDGVEIDVHTLCVLALDPSAEARGMNFFGHDDGRQRSAFAADARLVAMPAARADRADGDGFLAVHVRASCSVVQRSISADGHRSSVS